MNLIDVGDIFGKVSPPPAIKSFVDTNITGTGGISQFLSNLIVLFYSIAAIVIIFMLLWGAFDWITSEGDKEKIASARNKIMSALIGFMLFGITFAIISVLGTFTGIKFFHGQNVKVLNEPGFKFLCPDGTRVGGGSDDPDIACKGHGT